MTALQSALAQAKAENRAALIGYLPVGYPDVPLSIAAMLAMVEGGVDIVEVGVPYSDPVMDGPTIQAAVDPAVRAGVSVADALTAVSCAGPDPGRIGRDELLEPDRAVRGRLGSPRPWPRRAARARSPRT